MAAQRAQQLPAPAIPQLHRIVPTAAGQRLAIRAPYHRVNRTRVAAQCAQQLPALAIPLLHRVVITAAGQRLAVRTPRHGEN